MAKHEDERDDKKQLMVVWQGYEFEHREKDGDWYWALAIISAALAAAAAIFGNYLFAALILVAAFSVAVHAAHQPPLKEFRIDHRGVKIGTRLYAYRNIASFWLEEKTEPSLLFIELERAVLPLLFFPVGTLNVSAIREILLEYIPEKEQAVPVSHRLFETLGF